MLSSKRLLPLVLASATVVCPSFLASQNAGSPPPNGTTASQRVRSFRVKYLGSFERVSLDEIEPKLQKKALFPLAEKPYDQVKVGAIMAEIIERYKEHGLRLAQTVLSNLLMTFAPSG